MPPLDMPCPLCGKTLTENDFDPKHGRFHCPACFGSSAEARKGWLPLAAQPIRQTPDTPAGLSRINADRWFAKNAKGEPIARERTCECGRRFTQRLLSQHFLEIAEKAKAIELVAKQIPGFYIPVHCPPCERRDLGMQGRKDEYKHQATHIPPFGEAAD